MMSSDDYLVEWLYFKNVLLDDLNIFQYVYSIYIYFVYIAGFILSFLNASVFKDKSF